MSFSLQVFAQRRPVLHKLLDWEDELFALVTTFLDRQSLASSSSTFADSLYGLRRAPYTKDGPPKSLTEQQKKVALLFLVSAKWSLHVSADGELRNQRAFSAWT
jgi:peroxin-12